MSEEVEGKSEVGELLHLLWLKLNLGSGEFETLLDRMLMSIDNLLFFDPEFTSMVFSVVNDVLRILNSFLILEEFSLINENSLRSPVLFKGAAFSSTISRLVAESDFVAKFGITDLATLIGGDEISSSLLLLLIDEPVDVLSTLCPLHLCPRSLSLLEGDCSRILVGFPAAMVINVFVNSFESPFSLSQLLDVLNNKFARY